MEAGLLIPLNYKSNCAASRLREQRQCLLMSNGMMLSLVPAYRQNALHASKRYLKLQRVELLRFQVDNSRTNARGKCSSDRTVHSGASSLFARSFKPAIGNSFSCAVVARPVKAAPTRARPLLLLPPRHLWSITCHSADHHGTQGPFRVGRRQISLWGKDKEKRPDRDPTHAASNGVDGIARKEEEVLATLSDIRETCTGKGVIQLGLVQDVSIIGEDATCNLS